MNQLRANFRKSLLKKGGRIEPESQSAHVLALDFGLLTDEAECRAAGTCLAELIRSKAGPKHTGMTTGFHGSKPLLPMLTATRHHDLAVSIGHRGLPPLPHGRIAVHWEKQDGGSLLYQATAPPNTTAQLTLPNTSPWKQGDQGPDTRTLPPGTHRFVIR